MMADPALVDMHGHFTWDDYRSWDDGERWELIGGVAYSMSPAPSTRHQRIQSELNRQFGNHFAGRKCEVFPAPTDVKLSAEDVVQPDLAVVCDPQKIKRTHIEGAPTLVVEILSPSTAFHDRSRKLKLYAESGVAEVWLVSPYPHCVEVLVLDAGKYRIDGWYGKGDALECPTFPEFKMDLEALFDFPVDPGEELKMVREGRPPYPDRYSRRAPKERT